MLEVLRSLDRLQAWCLALGLLIVAFLIRKAKVDYKIRKTGGVRAAVLATNPILGKGPSNWDFYGTSL